MNRPGMPVRLALIAAAAVASVPPAGMAQSETTAGLQEVVVTARRVEENLQETPVAVSAFTEQMLEDRSVTNVGDVSNYTPNLFATSGPTGGNDGFFYIRGVGQYDLNPAVDPGVGTYLDGVYLGRIMGSSFDSMDIARIEVMRGPQGTLYGRNTMGGAINVVTQDPGDVFGAKVKVTGGSRDRLDAQFSVDVPMSDQFGMKITGLTRNQDGWGKRASDGESFADIETVAGRIKALWTPNDDLEVRLALDGSNSDGTPSHQVLIGYAPFPTVPGLPPVTPLGVPFPVPGSPYDFAPYIAQPYGPNGMFQNNSSVPADASLDVWGASGTIDWDVGGLHLKSITSYRDLDQYHPQDYEETPFAFFEAAFNTDQSQFSQELQLTGQAFDERLDWLVGAYYYEEDIFHNNQVCMGGNNGVGWAPTGPGGSFEPLPGFAILTDRSACLQNNQRYDLDIDAWAVFTHLSYRINDRWTAIAGVRYTDETKDYAFDSYIDNTAGVFSFFGFPPISFPTLSPSNPMLTVSPYAKDSWDSTDPKFGIEYQAAEEVMLYASYAEGFKSGGYNGRPTPNTITNEFEPLTSFEPEEIKTWEVGMKAQWLDQRLRTNLAVFSSTYKDIQQLVVDPTTGFFNQINAAKANIKGFELEVAARPVENFDIDLSVGYTDAEYTDLDPRLIAAGVTKSDPLVNTPEWTASTGAQYTFSLGDMGSLALRADYRYTDEVCYNAACTALDTEDSVGLVNLRGTWYSNDDRLAVSVFGLNVTDEEYYANRQDVIGGGLGVAFAMPGRPSEWGVEFSYRFGY
ncbi:MAG: TonB-dependent receptor [Gammaproteobacteria bacterium]|nr:TonB-dependent receptor [Gammaproteobacteria bacterium]